MQDNDILTNVEVGQEYILNSVIHGVDPIDSVSGNALDIDDTIVIGDEDLNGSGEEGIDVYEKLYTAVLSGNGINDSSNDKIIDRLDTIIEMLGDQEEEQYIVSDPETSISGNSIMTKPINEYTVMESELLFTGMILLGIVIVIAIKKGVPRWK